MEVMEATRWPQDRDDRLAELWRLGKSAREIGAELGVSRNAILGRVKRLRDGGKIDVGFRAESKSQKNARREAPADITGCRFIAGDPCAKPVKWCGKPLKQGAYWCEAHYAICYRPKNEGVNNVSL
jgi:GcrA cell cycle regulator